MMREMKRERFRQQVNANNKESPILALVLAGVAIYFALYLWLRDESTSIIPSYLILFFLLICLAILISLLASRWGVTRLFGGNDLAVRYPKRPYARSEFDGSHMYQAFNAPYNRQSFYSPAPPLGSILQPQPPDPEPRRSLPQSPFSFEYSSLPTPAKLPPQPLPPLYQSDYESLSNNSLALELYERMGIRQKIAVWIENVRYWLSYTLLPTILRRHQQNLEQLNKLLGFYNRSVVFHRFDDQPMTNVRPTLWEDLYNSVINCRGAGLQGDASLGYMMMHDERGKANLTKLLKERAAIEKYLRLKDNASATREYVIERLKQLQANFTGEYNNSREMNDGSRTWNSIIIKDSEVSY